MEPLVVRRGKRSQEEENRFLRLREKTYWRAVEYVVPAPAAAVRRVLSTSADPRAGARDVGHAIFVDYGLTLELLKKANSAFFALGKRQILSVHHIVVLMGLDAVLQVVLEHPTFPTLELKKGRAGGDIQKLLLGLSTLLGLLARELATPLDLDPVICRTCATYQGLGHLLLASVAPRAYRLVWEARREQRRQVVVSKTLTGWRPSELALAVVRTWNLPGVLRQCIAKKGVRRPVYNQKVVRFYRLMAICDTLFWGIAAGSRRQQQAALDQLKEELSIRPRTFSRAMKGALAGLEQDTPYYRLILEEILGEVII